jgi:hypothetical protein
MTSSTPACVCNDDEDDEREQWPDICPRHPHKLEDAAIELAERLAARRQESHE